MIFVHTKIYIWKPETGEYTNVSKTFAAKITILDRGYKASGQDPPTFYSGTVCSLDKPFTVMGHNGPLTYTLKFTPSGDGQSGAGTLAGGYASVSWSGNGPYKVEGFDGNKPRILFDVTTTATHRISGSGTGTMHIDLTPLETNECQ